MDKFISGVKISNISKLDLLNFISESINTNSKKYIVTPYSEFIVAAQNDELFKKVLNNSHLSLADGFGIQFGMKYLSLKGNRYLDILKCLFMALFNKKFFKNQIKEKLSGSEVIYDISELAAKNSYSVFFLGGFDFGHGNTGEIAAKKLKAKYPDLKIAGHYADGSANENEDEKTVEIINSAKPNILFVAYGPVKQEKWIARNYQKLDCNISIGLGGTFDYVSGEKRQVPKILRKAGLEGILRPFVSEKGNPKLIWKRLKRAWGGIIKYIFLLISTRKKQSSTSFQ